MTDKTLKTKSQVAIFNILLDVSKGTCTCHNKNDDRRPFLYSIIPFVSVEEVNQNG